MNIVEKCLIESISEAHDLNVHDYVPIIKDPPTAAEFFSNYVSKNSPFILKGGICHWTALSKWSPAYFRETMSEKMVTVAVTPNGYADAVNGDRFVMPEEMEMKFCDFLDSIEEGEDESDVFYIQKQNSNMTSDFPEIIGDIESHINWATDAFGAKPEAVNFWMGQKDAITSMHKDHYENLYAVISGEKTFTLHPPCDRPFIPHKNYKPAKYQKVGETWTIKDLLDSQPVPWIAIDPLNPDLETYPMYKNCKTLTASVKAGDLLYLPAMWFHHVTQTNGTIAVNFWYDMDFDWKYSFYQTLDNLSKSVLGT
ncbi:bifunctional peptidase and (3S)-lysyl hydroxylase Jmjd7-like [Styela clava]